MLLYTTPWSSGWCSDSFSNYRPKNKTLAIKPNLIGPVTPPGFWSSILKYQLSIVVIYHRRRRCRRWSRWCRCCRTAHVQTIALCRLWRGSPTQRCPQLQLKPWTASDSFWWCLLLPPWLRQKDELRNAVKTHRRIASELTSSHYQLVSWSVPQVLDICPSLSPPCSQLSKAFIRIGPHLWIHPEHVKRTEVRER